jgi:hypothetical protein
LYSYSCFLEAGVVSDDFVVREGGSASPFTVDTSFVDFWFDETVREQIREWTNRLSDRLHLSDGLVHLQFMMENGEAFLIEATRRCPGDLYAMLIEHSTGYEYAAKYASFFIDVPWNTRRSGQKSVVRHTVTAMNEGIWQGFEALEDFRLVGSYQLEPLGAKIGGTNSSRVGLMFVAPLAEGKKAVTDLFDEFLHRRVYR